MGHRASRLAARRGPQRQPQAGRAGHAPAWHPGSGSAPLSRVHDRQQARPADRSQPAGSEFRGTKPDQIWLADITYIATGEGWLYLAVILDLFTRKVVSWAMREHMRAELTIAALTMAIQRRCPGPGLIHHSDRGSQYAASDYRKILQAAAITQSMNRKGNSGTMPRWRASSVA